ncbi:MAG: hypothetical protein Q8Q37_00910 [bacterium]|nr:hypothetical protein [bacterium]
MLKNIMSNKKTIKRIKSKTKNKAKKAKLFIKKANKNVNDIVSILKKQWKKEQPQREEFKISAQKVLENSIKMGSDVFETVKKDINEIKKQKRK